MIAYTTDNLGGLSHIAHAFFSRQGGVSEGRYATLNCGPGSNDARVSVLENRRRALAMLAGESAQADLVTLYQVHSAKAVGVDEPWQVGEGPQADAMATRVPGIALGILTADCAPVLLADAEARVVGAAHAGWRGALSGVIDSVVLQMERLGAERAHIHASVGPCIGQPAYEVGEEFRAQFLEFGPPNSRYFVAGSRSGHWQFDLPGYVEQRLRDAGVDNVSTSGRCTYINEAEYFSFRRATHRSESDYGRQLSAIMLKPRAN